MPSRADINAKAAQLRALFERAGAQVVEPHILLPADTLLDLYGEDIRARAYVTSDALRGEQMLRPDFTVPVVQMHMTEGAEPARYTYSGEVFRRQEHDPSRANEYVQVGYEIFDGADPAAADADVFARVSNALQGLSLRPATGDIGLIMAAVEGLRTTERRKAALMRHIWRPRRFRQLLDRFAADASERARRLERLNQIQLEERATHQVGKRSLREISQRIAALQEDASDPPLSQAELDTVDALLNVRQMMPSAIEQLREIAVDMPQIDVAIARLALRADALAARGVSVDALAFETSYGRTSLEYYDGFVFGFYAETRPDMPSVASGGRYDALTRRLGQGRAIPAVGGVMRPGLMLELEARHDT